MKSNTKAIVSSLFVMLLWGLLFPLVKLGYRLFEINSTGDILVFAGARFFVCGAFITAFALLRNPHAFGGVKARLPQVLLSGLFAIILHYGFTYTGLNLTDGSKTAILKQLGVVFYICFSSLFFPEDRLTARKFLGLALGVSGILAINTGAGGLHFAVGDALIIAASFCTVFSNVISKKVLAFVSPLVVTGVSQLFGGAVLLAVGSAAGGRVSAVLPHTSAQLGLCMAIIAASSVSYCLWFTVVRSASLSGLFLIKFAEPMFASLFSLVLLGEDIFRLNYLIAFVLISVGIVVGSKATVSDKKDRETSRAR